jgi:hypothetical protein
MKISENLYIRLTIVNTVVLAVAVVSIVLVFAAFRVPVLRVLDGFFQSEQFSSQAVNSVQKMVFGDPAQKPLPIFELKIKPNYMRQIDQLAKQLVKKGFMTKVDRLWVPATFWADGNQYKVKVRLRGDYLNHWIRAKKSWRVKFKKHNLFRNYREINLVLPEDRQNETEHVAFKMGRKIGLLVPDSGFAAVKINSVGYGAYFWFEQMSKETLERLQYPEGEIFSDTNAWIDNRTASADYDGGLRYPEFELRPSFYKSKIHTKKATGVYIADRWRLFLKLIANADQKRIERELPYFVNIDRFVLWSSAVWMFASTHAQESANVRWYYDTTTGLFEPLLYDIYMFIPPAWAKAGRTFNLSSFEAESPNKIASQILRIPWVQQMRNKRLWSLIKRFDELIITPSKLTYARLRPALPQGVDRKYLHRTDGQHESRLQKLEKIRTRLTRHLSFARVFAEPALRFDDGPPRLEISLLPDSMVDLVLSELTLTTNDQDLSDIAPLSATIAQVKKQSRRDAKILVNSSNNAARINFEDLRLYSQRDPDLQQRRTEWILTLRLPPKSLPRWRKAIGSLKISGQFTNSVTGASLEKRFVRWSRPTLIVAKDLAPSPATPAEFFLKTAGLPFRKEGDAIVLDAGTYNLNQPLIIPGKFRLILRPGVTLLMGPKASILVRRALDAKGTAETPIRIVAQNPSQPWGTVAVVSAPNKSVLKNLTISGGSEAWIQGIHLSGQLCFYKSDVDVINSVITNAKADDSLNIKHARFSIRGSRIEKNLSDGFDGDWVTGVINHSSITSNGGDGIDFSGSHVLVQNSLLRDMGDKGVSAGENSRVVIFNSLIRSSKVGIASKDLSDVSVYASAFVGNKTALSLYRKKPIFGGGKADVTASLFLNNTNTIDVDTESFASLAHNAVDTPLTNKKVKKTNLTIGSLGNAVNDFGNRGVLLKGTASPTVVGSFQPKSFLGVTFPNLSGRTVGMIGRLEDLP